jgi:hypothetical protein
MPVILANYMPVIRRWRSGESGFQVSLGKQFLRPYLENIYHTHKERAGGVFQLAEHLSRKREALSTNCSTTKNKNQPNKKE